MLLASGPLSAATNTQQSDNMANMGMSDAINFYIQALPMELDSLTRVQLLDKSEDILTNIIKADPKSLEAHRKLLAVYMQKLEYNKGISIVKNAINLSPEDPKLFITLAILYQKIGALEYSLAMVEQALELDPQHIVAKDYKVLLQKKIEADKAGGTHNSMSNSMPSSGAPHGKLNPVGAAAPSAH